MVKDMRKRLVIGSVIGLLVIAAVLVAVMRTSYAPSPPETTKIIVADARTTHHLNLYVAQEKGLFQKYGLDVEIIQVDELAAARDAVVAGQADVFWSCPTVAIAAIAGGAPIRIIAQVKIPCTSVLLVPPDSAINKYKDLDGKSIGGISPSCEAVIAIRRVAKREGAEFFLEKLAGGPAIAALEAGKVDGAILEEPHASIAELRGFRVMFREAAEAIPCRTINARTGFLENNADALKRMIRAVDEANAIILQNPVADDIVDIAANYTGAPKEAIRNGNHRLGFTIYLDEEGLLDLANALIEQGAIRSHPGLEMFAREFGGITWEQ